MFLAPKPNTPWLFTSLQREQYQLGDAGSSLSCIPILLNTTRQVQVQVENWASPASRQHLSLTHAASLFAHPFFVRPAFLHRIGYNALSAIVPLTISNQIARIHHWLIRVDHRNAGGKMTRFASPLTMSYSVAKINYTTFKLYRNILFTRMKRSPKLHC